MRPKKKATSSKLVDAVVYKLLKKISDKTLPASDDVSLLISKISFINSTIFDTLEKICPAARTEIEISLSNIN